MYKYEIIKITVTGYRVLRVLRIVGFDYFSWYNSDGISITIKILVILIIIVNPISNINISIIIIIQYINICKI